MTLHMVRLFVEPPRGDAESAVDNWVSNHTEWTVDPVSHNLREATAEVDDSGTAFLRGDYRFEQTTSADELLDDLADRLTNFQGGLWFRAAYHACDHDEENPASCDWDQTREGGTIPDDIPTIT